MVIRVELKFNSLSSAVKYFEKMMSPYRCGEMASMAFKQPYYTFLKDDQALENFNARNNGEVKGIRVEMKEVENVKR
jgi:hypothetical protein